MLAVVAWKTYLSYFRKKSLYSKRKWLGIAMFVAWSYNWITAAVSYYLRTLPSNPQHPAPVFLLPYSLLGVQLMLPYILGAGVGALIVRKALKVEAAKAARKKSRVVDRMVCADNRTMARRPAEPKMRETIRFSHLDIDDGLSGNSVRAILQDRHGIYVVWHLEWPESI